MKNLILATFTPLFAAFFFSFPTARLSAQHKQALQENIAYQKSAETVKNADYIFEGYCKEASGQYFRGYHDGDSSALFVAIELTVVHCYKGNLAKGTVKLIRPVTYEEHRVGFGLNTHYIYLCKKPDYPVPEGQSNFDNQQTLQLISEYFTGWYVPCFGFDFKPDSINYAVAGLYERKFRTKAEFHDFLSRASNDITLPPQETEGKKNIPSPKDNPSPQKPDTTSNGENHRLGEANEIIKYSVRNQRVYAANGKNYFAFDVYGQVFTSGLNLVEAAVILKFKSPLLAPTQLELLAGKATLVPACKRTR